jgi:hypothetical protein
MATSTTLDLHPALTLRDLGRQLSKVYFHVANTPWLACTIAATLPILLRLALLPWFPVPLPAVHDEFSYLLGADTFASGRITNPPHPLWQHFESMHIIQQPTYASKYPPLQSLVLAAGMKLGHPWIGVLLSVAVMGACFYWCLQGWLPPTPALLGALLASLRFGTFSYWTNSYWGGIGAVIGGALLIGAMPRLIKQPRWQTVFVFALGLVVLGNTRPYEGAILAIPTVGVLIVASVRNHNAMLLARTALVPLIATLIPATLLMGYYNYRVTNHWLLMPYQLHQQQYAVDSPFLWGKPKTPPVYHHAVLSDFWTKFDLEVTRNAKEHWFTEKLKEMQIGFGTLVASLWIALVFVFLPLPRSSSTNWLTFPILIAFVIGLMPLKAVEPHYFAPIAALEYVRFMNTATWICKWKPQGRPWGPLAAMFAFEFILLQSFLLIFPAVPEMFFYGRNRNALEKHLAGMGGQHLVIVRYSPDHWAHVEWVYNKADIDASQIVWARDMGTDGNRDLLTYYPHRSQWLLEPDKSLNVVAYPASK